MTEVYHQNAESSRILPKILVFPRRALTPLQEYPPQEGIEVFPLLEGIDALERRYDVDAHMVMYSAEGEDQMPRLAKKYPKALKGLRDDGVHVLMHWVVLDVDVPNHKNKKLDDTPRAWWISQLAAITGSREASRAGWYHTRGGYHLIWALDPPLEPAGWEKAVSSLRTRLRKDGIEINEECKDWPRLMRLPRVTRDDDGEVQDRSMDLSRLGYLDLSADANRTLASVSRPQKISHPSKVREKTVDGDWEKTSFAPGHRLRVKLERADPLSNTPSRRIKGEPGRDSEILSVAGALVKAMPRPDADVVVRLMLPSVLASRRDDPQEIGDEDTLRDRVKTIVEKEVVARAEHGEAIPPETAEDDVFPSEVVTGTIPLLATDGAKYYAWDSAVNGYYGPLAKDVVVVWLTNSDPTNAALFQKEDGALMQPQSILKQQGCGRVARVTLAPEARVTTYDPETMTLHEAPVPTTSSVPVVRRDGSVFTGPGYDEQTHTIVSQDAVRVDLPDGDPDEQEVQEAKDRLSELLTDFPFRDESDRGAALSLLLTAVLRSWVDGVTPLFLLRGNRPGTGKGLLADLVSLLVTGSEGTPIRYEGDRELEKKTTAAVSEGTRVVFWDEVPPGTDLRSKFVDSAITGPNYFGRILGSTKTFTCRNRITWIAAGNNVGFGSKDIFRRTVAIRLDTTLEDPEERDDFSVPGGASGLRSLVLSRRADLVRACHVLLSSFLSSGSPRVSGTLGGFETWCKTVRSLVAHHWGAQADPLGNRAEGKASRAHTREGALYALLGIVWRGQSRHPNGWSPQDVTTWSGTPTEQRAVSELVDEITEGAEDRARVTRLGIALSSLVDTPIRAGETIVRLRRLPRGSSGTRYKLFEADPISPF